MSFGFDKVKKPEPPDRNLDLSGLRMEPPVPPVEKEKKALATVRRRAECPGIRQIAASRHRRVRIRL